MVLSRLLQTGPGRQGRGPARPELSGGKGRAGARGGGQPREAASRRYKRVRGRRETPRDQVLDHGVERNLARPSSVSVTPAGIARSRDSGRYRGDTARETGYGRRGKRHRPGGWANGGLGRATRRARERVGERGGIGEAAEGQEDREADAKPHRSGDRNSNARRGHTTFGGCRANCIGRHQGVAAARFIEHSDRGDWLPGIHDIIPQPAVKMGGRRRAASCYMSGSSAVGP